MTERCNAHREINAGYQIKRGQHKKINHLFFMDALKLYGNNGRDSERLKKNFRIFWKNIAMSLVKASVNMSQ